MKGEEEEAEPLRHCSCCSSRSSLPPSFHLRSRTRRSAAPGRPSGRGAPSCHMTARLSAFGSAQGRIGLLTTDSASNPTPVDSTHLPRFVFLFSAPSSSSSSLPLKSIRFTTPRGRAVALAEPATALFLARCTRATLDCAVASGALKYSHRSGSYRWDAESGLYQ
jgi:hypothetical protein